MDPQWGRLKCMLQPATGAPCHRLSATPQALLQRRTFVVPRLILSVGRTHVHELVRLLGASVCLDFRAGQSA